MDSNLGHKEIIVLLRIILVIDEGPEKDSRVCDRAPWIRIFTFSDSEKLIFFSSTSDVSGYHLPPRSLDLIYWNVTAVISAFSGENLRF